MERDATTLRIGLDQLWTASRSLTFTGLLMGVVLAAALVGLVVDDRIILGAPAWLKPAKFAASIGVYTLTLAWMFTFIPEWPRTRRVVGVMSAVLLIVEMVIIGLQAARGTTSHFNIGTPLDAVLWGIMGAAIMVQTTSAAWIAVALWRHPFRDAALGWALRLAVIVTVVGASIGGMMTRPTEAQLAEARVTHRLSVAGQHTVGGLDGGPGLPGTGWSTEHGDIRAAHFAGLHALQVIPLLYLLFWRRMPTETAVRLVVVSAISYTALFGLILWQALRGQPLVHPDGLTLAAAGTWMAATAAALWLVRSAPPRFA